MNAKLQILTPKTKFILDNFFFQSEKLHHNDHPSPLFVSNRKEAEKINQAKIFPE